MQVGICPLCKLPKQLVESHFIPAAAYRAHYAEGLPVNDPMMMTPKRINQSSKQIKEVKFCEDCEDRFNNGGERWMSDKLATLETFPLRDMVAASQAVHDEPDFKAYSCDRVPEFKLDKFVHYAAGIFWRATCTWRSPGGPLAPLELGPYNEPLRQFIEGAAPFPSSTCLVAYLDGNSPPLIAMTTPRQFQNDQFHLFGFYINGLECLLCVGKMAPLTHLNACVATSPDHPIFVVPDVGHNFFKLPKPFTAKSVPSNRIMRTLAAWKSLRGIT